MSQTDPYGAPTHAPPGQSYGAPPGYPLQPPPVAPKSSGCGRMLLIALGAGAALTLLLVAVGLAAGSSDDEPSADGGGDGVTAEQPAGGEAEGPEIFAIGETAHTGDFDVVVHGVQDPYTSTNQFDAPTAGNRFVAVEASITNTSDQPQSFSSLMQVELTDSANRPWDAAIAGMDLPLLDAATVAPGEVRRGWAVFDVPPDATGFRVRFKGNLTATGSLFQL